MNRKGLSRLRNTRKTKPQVPPLRFAPVGMTIPLSRQELQLEKPHPCNRIVIPTGAKRSGGTCGSFPRVRVLTRLFSP
jgi:hypothetical protein